MGGVLTYSTLGSEVKADSSSLRWLQAFCMMFVSFLAVGVREVLVQLSTNHDNRSLAPGLPYQATLASTSHPAALKFITCLTALDSTSCLASLESTTYLATLSFWPCVEWPLGQESPFIQLSLRSK